MLDRSKGAPTLKEQLIQIIKEQIETGVYKEGELIPREIDYQERYNVSRITVRSAIGVLEQKGYLQRVKGKGTIVKTTKISEPLLKIKGFTEEMKAKGIIPSTSYAHMELVKAPLECAKALDIEEGMPVYLLNRIRCMNGVPVASFQTYIKAAINMDLEDDYYYDSLYEYLEEKHGIMVKKIQQTITADLAVKELEKPLQCAKGDPLLVLKRIGYDGREQVFEYTICRYVAHRYEYYLEINQ